MHVNQNKAEKEKTVRKRKGIRLLTLDLCILLLAVFLFGLVLAANQKTRETFRKQQEAVDLYVSLRQEVQNMEVASDYLTEQARAFAATGDRQFLDLYFEETDVTRRRDKALAVIEGGMSDSVSFRYLSDALQDSSELEEIEYYAMCLVIASKGDNMEEYPARLQEIRLSDEDMALTDVRKAQEAEHLLYDQTYQDYKTRIRSNVAMCTDTLLEITRADQIESSRRLQYMLQMQSVLVICMLALVALTIICNWALILYPLQKISAKIRKQEPLPLSGSSELQLLEETYNAISEENRKNNNQLSFDATHDSLTRLYNRGVFERERLAAGRRKIALLLVDVDYFKKINDNYGHDVGDKVLQKVAAALQENFRSEDFVCRIGGDEFAVIMVHTTPDMRPILEQKIARVRELLRDTADGLPEITLSVGIAFTDQENPDSDIYKNADAALYQVKEAGRNGQAFYMSTGEYRGRFSSTHFDLSTGDGSQ